MKMKQKAVIVIFERIHEFKQVWIFAIIKNA